MKGNPKKSTLSANDKAHDVDDDDAADDNEDAADDDDVDDVDEPLPETMNVECDALRCVCVFVCVAVGRENAIYGQARPDSTQPRPGMDQQDS